MFHDQGSIPGRARIFMFLTASRQALGPTQPPLQCVPGVLSPRLKWPGRETDRLLPSSVEVKSAWSYTSTPTLLYIFR